MNATALKSVQEILGGSDLRLCESPSLRLEKFVRIGDNLKGEEIQQVVSCQARHAKEIPVFCPKGGEQFAAKLEGRLIVNQAGGILENAGICLHPHFGMPYIPGSAVKGIARHAAWCEWNEEEDLGKKADTAKHIARIFGFPTGDTDSLDPFLKELGEKTHSGCIAFLAAVPDGKAWLVTDIVNCHHKAYYSGTQPDATDNEQPVPLCFPAVESGATFLFTLVPLRTAGECEVAEAKKWLLKAITENGAGAKTAAGYGWFTYSEEENLARREEARKREAQRQETLKMEAFVSRIAALGNLDSSTPAFAAEIDAITMAPLFAKVPDAAKEAFRKQLLRLPVKSPLDAVREEWERSLNLKAIINGAIKRFDSGSEEKKTAIVQLLREPQGKGHEVWMVIKTEQKGDIGKAVLAIRVYSKETLKLGKMP